MCDTVLASAGSTAERMTIFGKNSDRQRNEAQAVTYFPSARHALDTSLRCTYINISQVQHTHAVLVCKPFWMWGAEMGANEHGVVIGNEGVHARSAAPESPALTGMDLLRLALERATSAAEALNVITTLLERYGQGGNCGHVTPAYYNSAFMVADPNEAYVLETVGRDWLFERVRGVRAMSNRYTIQRSPHGVSAGLKRRIIESGWSSEEEPNYADVIANPGREHIGNAGARHARSAALLESHAARLSPTDVMSILRDHGASNVHGSEWRAECASIRTICMHAGAADRSGQTVGSMVSQLYPGGESVHWVTATAAPCISIFKPVLMSVPLPSQGPALSDKFNPSTLWWRHEQLHRQALRGDFAKFIEDIRAERDALEADFQVSVMAVLSAGDARERAQVVARCWEAASQAEEHWLVRMKGRAVRCEDASYVAGWDEMNRLAGASLAPPPLGG